MNVVISLNFIASFIFNVMTKIALSYLNEFESNCGVPICYISLISLDEFAGSN